MHKNDMFQVAVASQPTKFMKAVYGVILFKDYKTLEEVMHLANHAMVHFDGDFDPEEEVKHVVSTGSVTLYDEYMNVGVTFLQDEAKAVLAEVLSHEF